jgi:hypothetical protein
VKGPNGDQGLPPGLAGPAPAAPPTCLQRLMFPMDGFHGHFPFVTRAVMSLATSPLMFQACVTSRPEEHALRYFAGGGAAGSRLHHREETSRPLKPGKAPLIPRIAGPPARGLAPSG